MRLSLGSNKRFSYQAISSPTEDQGDFEPLLTLDAEQKQGNGSLDSGNGSPQADGRRTAEIEMNRRPGMIKLLVLKLDGTSFDLSVSGAATVKEMKNVLEKTVNELEVKTLGYCDIQWEQVWGNFCLCYMNQKLLDDDALLRAFGIHDDDQVQFLRHTSDVQEAQPKRRSSLCKSIFT